MKTLALILLLPLSACSFVQVTEAGAGVVQMGAGDVATCEDKGVVSAQTQARFVINRNAEAVSEELINLARNEAAGLGANAIVPIGEPENGAQRFRAYLCR